MGAPASSFATVWIATAPCTWERTSASAGFSQIGNRWLAEAAAAVDLATPRGGRTGPLGRHGRRHPSGRRDRRRRVPAESVCRGRHAARPGRSVDTATVLGRVGRRGRHAAVPRKSRSTRGRRRVRPGESVDTGRRRAHPPDSAPGQGWSTNGRSTPPDRSDGDASRDADARDARRSPAAADGLGPDARTRGFEDGERTKHIGRHPISPRDDARPRMVSLSVSRASFRRCRPWPSRARSSFGSTVVQRSLIARGATCTSARIGGPASWDANARTYACRAVRGGMAPSPRPGRGVIAALHRRRLNEQRRR